MRIAFCIFKMLAFGGLSRDCLRLMKAAHAHGHEVHVFTQSWQIPRLDIFTLHDIQVKAWTNHGKAKVFVKKVLPRLKDFDCVVGFNRMPGLDVYFAGDYCFAADARRRRGAWFRLTKRYRTYAALEAAVYSPATHTHIVLMTEQEQAVIQAVYHTPAARFTVIAPGIEKDRVPVDPFIRETLRAQYHIAQNDVLLLSVGSFFQRKGVDRSLAAFLALPHDLKSRTHLIVIGEDAKLSSIKQCHQRSAHIHFLGGREDAIHFMLAADVLLHPARRETGGVVLIEALVAGLPIVVSGACGYAEWVKAAGAGVVLPEPFSQTLYDETVKDMITAQRTLFKESMQQYMTTRSFFSWTDNFLLIIEKHRKK